MNSSFSDAGYLIPRRPHPRSYFLSSRNYDFLEGPGFLAQVFSLAPGRRTRCIPSEQALAGFQNSLASLIQALGDTVAPTSYAIPCSPRRPSSTMRIFSSAESCLRVARQCPSQPIQTTASGSRNSVLSPLRNGYDEPEISLLPSANSISRVLIPDLSIIQQSGWSRTRRGAIVATSIRSIIVSLPSKPICVRDDQITGHTGRPKCRTPPRCATATALF